MLYGQTANSRILSTPFFVITTYPQWYSVCHNPRLSIHPSNTTPYQAVTRSPDGHETRTCIDGKQRLTSILRYVPEPFRTHCYDLQREQIHGGQGSSVALGISSILIFKCFLSFLEIRFAVSLHASCIFLTLTDLLDNRQGFVSYMPWLRKLDSYCYI